jgi:two-component sensor histidine kinase
MIPANDYANAKSPKPEALLRETNHRIANHLGLLIAMIRAQSTAVAKGPLLVPRESAAAMLKETAGKLVSVGQLHRRLAEQPEAGEVMLSDYMLEACATLVSGLSLGERVFVAHKLESRCRVLPEQAQYIGLLIGEIVMNAVKHAHPTGIPVQVTFSCEHQSDGRLRICIADDGVGLPERRGKRITEGVGLGLIRALVQALQADLRIESDSLGLTFIITLPPNVQTIKREIMSDGAESYVH